MSTRKVVGGALVMGLLASLLVATYVRAGPQEAADSSVLQSSSAVVRAPSVLDAPWSANIMVTDSPVRSAAQPAIALDSAGSVYAVWNDSRTMVSHIYFARSTDQGASWGTNRQIDELQSGQSLPDIAVDDAGIVHVTWVDGRAGQGVSYLDIYYARSTDGGVSWSNHSRINNDPGVAMQSQPAIAVGASGKVYIVWTDLRNGNEDIYCASSTNAGVFWGPSYRVDDGGAATQANPDVAVDASGKLHAVWTDERNGDRDVYAAWSTNDGQTWSAAIKVNDNFGAGDQAHPAIATDRSGITYVVWDDRRNGSDADIYLGRSADGGLSWAASYRVDDSSSGIQEWPTIAVDGDGRLYSVWEDGRTNSNRDIYASQSTDGGFTWSASTKVNDNAGTIGHRTPCIAVDRVGKTYAAWQDERTPAGIYSARQVARSFTVSATPPARTIVPGGSTSYGIALTAEGGFNSPVTLSLLGKPAEVEASFSANPVTPPASATLNINTTSDVPMTTHVLTVRAVGDGLTREVPVSLQVTCGTTGPTVNGVTANLDGMAGDGIGTFISLPGKGKAVINTFTAQVTPGTCPILAVIFTLNGQEKADTNGADGWSAQWDMSELPAGLHSLQVQAQDRAFSSPIRSALVDVLAQPTYVGASWVRDQQISWSPTEAKYTFSGTIPANPSFTYSQPFNIGYLGTLNNMFSSQVNIEERFSISGKWSASATGTLNATLLNISLVNQSYPAVPHLGSGTAGVAWYELPLKSFLLAQQRRTVYNGTVYSVAGVFRVRMSIDYGFNATLELDGTINSDWSLSAGLTPKVTATAGLNAWVDLLFGVAKAGVSATPRLGMGLPIVYQKGSISLKPACTYFDIWGSVWAKALWWRKTWGPYQFYCWDNGTGCQCSHAAASRALDTDEPPEPDLFAAPWLADNGAGQIMAVWIQDQEPDALSVDPEIVYAVWDGAAWSAPALLTQNERWETDPRVAFVAAQDALAVWTQNELTQDQSSEGTPLSDVLSNQELYYARWNGETWSAPARLTNNTVPDGSAALATDPVHSKALLAWVRDRDGSPDTKGDWDLYYATWDNSVWSTPSPLVADPAVAEAEVYVRYDSQGRAMAVWIQDHDADLNTNADRHVAYSVWDGQAWSAPVEPAAWPTGALYPSVAFDSADRPIVVFTSRASLESGEEGGTGNYDYLWSAYQKGDWTVQAIGLETPAEWPRVLVNTANQAIVVFREFGEAGTTHFAGEVAAAVADLNQATLQWGAPDLLTEEGAANWQVAFEIDPVSGSTQVLYVSGTPATAQGKAQALGNKNDQLYGLSLPFDPDLQIRPADITFSNERPAAGETVFMTATVRNKGFEEVGAPVPVRFFRGDPDAGGILIGQGTTGPSIAFGEKSAVAVAWGASGGQHDIYVLVDPNQQVPDWNRSNNKAHHTIGALPPPTDLIAATNAAESSILLSWTAPDAAGVAGYDVYRSTSSGSGYALIATVSTTHYEDSGLPDDVVFYYTVVAYDIYGVRSSYSSEASATLPGTNTPTPTPTATPTATPTPTPTRPVSRVVLPLILKH